MRPWHASTCCHCCAAFRTQAHISFALSARERGLFFLSASDVSINSLARPGPETPSTHGSSFVWGARTLLARAACAARRYGDLAGGAVGQASELVGGMAAAAAGTAAAAAGSAAAAVAVGTQAASAAATAATVSAKAALGGGVGGKGFAPVSVDEERGGGGAARATGPSALSGSAI